MKQQNNWIQRTLFKKVARQFIRNEHLEIIETADFVFERRGNEAIVTFKKIAGLRGFFSIDELRSARNITVILNTLERELDKRHSK